MLSQAVHAMGFRPALGLARVRADLAGPARRHGFKGETLAMKAQPLAAWAVVMVASLCAVFAQPARAQAPDSVYVAGSVTVDVTAGSGAAAREQAIEQAEALGFQRVARRVTLASDRAALGEPQATGVALQRMVLRVDVEDESNPTATRYRAQLSVRMNPDLVRSHLRNAGYTVVETRASPLLVIPGSAGVTPQAAAIWREVWERSGYAGDLVPIAVAPATAPTSPEWSRVDDIARAASASGALFANLTVSGQTYRAAVVETGPNMANRARGTLDARASGTSEVAIRAALVSLAQQVNDLVQEEWKSSILTGVGEPVRLTVSALYGSRDDWNRIKQGLQGSARLISAISIDAVARDGAVVSFSYVGTMQQLTDELRRNGLTLTDEPQGMELRAGRP